MHPQQSINGKQCTIQFHVGSLTLSHLEQGVFDKIIDNLNYIFDNESKLSVAIW